MPQQSSGTELPEGAARTLAKGVAAYIRATPATELPPGLAALKKTVQTPKGEGRHRAQLLAMLDDEALRALVLEWLEDGKPPLSKSELETLRLASERPEGWLDRLSERTKPSPAAKPESDPQVAELERKLEREKEAHRKAREEAKRAKEAERRAIKVERGRSLRLDEEVSDQKRLLGELAEDLKRAQADATKAQKENERLKRKARSDVDDLRQQVRKLRDENRDLKKRLADIEREAAAAAKAKVKASADSKKKTAERVEPKRTGPRNILKVPKGRLEDAPETLDAWLETPAVTLLVDGYNVTRSSMGFGHLTLEQQRDRLRDLLKKLSNRLKVPTVLVWDGGEVAPGTKRLSSGYLTEEYSEPDRSGAGTDKDRADRHIVELLKQMPSDPVVLATNDKGLQEEARAQRATIASSDQLLALLR